MGISRTKAPPELANLRDKLLELFAIGAGVGEVQDGAFVPPVDVLTQAGHIEVVVDVPGLEIQDLELFVDGQSLRVVGARHRHPVAAHHLMERSVGEFERIVELPHPVDPTSADVALDNGVLKISLEPRDTPCSGSISTRSEPGRE